MSSDDETDSEELYQLDDVDRGILHALQRDARNVTTADIAEQVPVSASTVRNRIQNLEESGVIDGYRPTLNYERAGYQLRVVFAATVPVEDRARLARKALRVRGVIDVRELLSGANNLYVEAVATSTQNLTQITQALSETGLSIQRSEIVTNHYTQPFGELEHSP